MERESGRPRTFMQGPRPVSVLLRAQLLFGSVSAVLGWTFLGSGCLMLIVFGTILGFDTSMHHFWGTLDRVSGRVISTEQTLRDLVGQSRGGATVHRTVRYEYTAGDEQRRIGVSVVVVKIREGTLVGGQVWARVPSPGDEIQIEYPRDHPSLSRVVGGYRDGGGGGWIVAVISAIFFGVGLLMAILGFFRGFRQMRVFSRGIMTHAKLVSMLEASYKVSNRQAYNLEFEFQAPDGLPYTVRSTTLRPEQIANEAAPRVLFDPKRPDAAVVLDSAPCAVRTGADGSLGVSNSKAALRVFVTLAVGLLACCAAILWWMHF